VLAGVLFCSAAVNADAALRYDLTIPLRIGSYPLASTDMKLLWRIFIVLTLAWLGTQGASACEHEHASTRTASMREAMRASAVHCDSSTNMRDTGSPCGDHTHSLCCMTMCGGHCSALLSTVGVTARAAASGMPSPHSDPARASITRAPPVRPPIV
jgi:hypothetical protein